MDREFPLLKKQLLPELPIWQLLSGHKLKSNSVHSQKQHHKEDTAGFSQCLTVRKVQERKRYHKMQSWGKSQPSLQCSKPIPWYFLAAVQNGCSRPWAHCDNRPATGSAVRFYMQLTSFICATVSCIFHVLRHLLSSWPKHKNKTGSQVLGLRFVEFASWSCWMAAEQKKLMIWAKEQQSSADIWVFS